MKSRLRCRFESFYHFWSRSLAALLAIKHSLCLSNMSHRSLQGSPLKVAIIGAGPAGLGAAIEFSRLPYVEWNLYEQATAIREIGAGISIQPSTWRMLENLGAAQNLKPEDLYRPADRHSVQHRLA
jgi:salicylate hydroxylase